MLLVFCSVTDFLPQNIEPQSNITRDLATVTPSYTKENFFRVRVRVWARVWIWARVAGAKYAGKNVVGHDVVRQDDGNHFARNKNLAMQMYPRKTSNYAIMQWKFNIEKSIQEVIKFNFK